MKRIVNILLLAALVMFASCSKHDSRPASASSKPADEAVLPGSHYSLAVAMRDLAAVEYNRRWYSPNSRVGEGKEGFAFAAVCEAVDRPETPSSHGNALMWQEYKIVLPLAGKASIGQLFNLHYEFMLFSIGGHVAAERAVERGEQVIWIVHRGTKGQLIGMKALPDNQTNRDAVIDAAPASQPASSPATQPTKELTLDLGNKVAMKLVLIPSGKFTMGSSSEEQVRASKDVKPNDLPLYRFKDESPQHEVTISQSFYMAVSHVTVDQFAAFVKDSDYQTDAEKDRSSDGVEIENGRDAVKRMDGLSWRKPSFDQGGDHPVVQVSWNDAKAFCDWLSKKTGKTVTLPTEAQFEYACRAGTKTAYPWGDNPDDGKGWASCRDQSFRKKLPGEPAETFFRWDDGFIFTSPVGSFKPNAFGLYDMIGNAFQWCSDWYDEGYYANAPKTDPQGPTSGAYHVLRGSGWGAYKFRCRSANRFCVNPPGRTDFYGFRVVVDVE